MAMTDPRPATLAKAAELERFYQELNELYHDVARTCGLSDSAFDILYALMMHDGLTQKQLREGSFMTKQTVSSSVSRLIADGLVEIAGTGRGATVSLSAAGAALVQERLQPVLAAECRALERLSPVDQDELLRLRGAYRTALRAELSAL